jgi:hypothetical protein
MASTYLASNISAKSGLIAAPAALNLPGPDAQELWHYIHQEKPYKYWRTFPDQPRRFIHVKENPHGDWIAVYINDEAYNSLVQPSSPFQMNYGSILVKENYSLSDQDPVSQENLSSVPVNLTALTVMYKVKGYHTRAYQEEWFWAMYTCKNGECNGVISTVSDQPWITEQVPKTNSTFEFFKGEVMAGKPWLCIQCHQRAQNPTDSAFGDYLWKLLPFKLMPK